MDFREYQEWAATKANSELSLEKRMLVAALGVAGEAGEVADLFKKFAGHGHPLDIDKLKKEAGDVLWYLAEIATVLGLDLGEIANSNREKLNKRYPNGFTPSASLNREV